MGNLNSVILEGIVKEVSCLSFLSDGTPVSSFALSVTNNTSNLKPCKVSYLFTVFTYGELAKKVNLMKSGIKVSIIGRLVLTRIIHDSDSKDTSELRIVAQYICSRGNNLPRISQTS